jgi:hypothetical protein
VTFSQSSAEAKRGKARAAMIAPRNTLRIGTSRKIFLAKFAKFAKTRRKEKKEN